MGSTTAHYRFRMFPWDLAVFLLAVDVDVEVMGWDATVDGVPAGRINY